MSFHSDTLYRTKSNQSLLLFLNAACLVGKQQIPILVFGLMRPGLEPTIYHTRCEHANHYTTDTVVFVCIFIYFRFFIFFVFFVFCVFILLLNTLFSGILTYRSRIHVDVGQAMVQSS